MDTKSYSEKLKDPRWQKKRLEILNRDSFLCMLCLDSGETLHVHHKSYHGEPWEASNEELETLCESCHKIVEYFKKNDSKIKVQFINKVLVAPYIDNHNGVSLCQTQHGISIFHNILSQPCLVFELNCHESSAMKSLVNWFD